LLSRSRAVGVGRPWSAAGSASVTISRSAAGLLAAASRGSGWRLLMRCPARRTAGTLLTWRYWSHRALWHCHAGDGCRAAADAEFAVDVLEVLGDGPRADLQPMGDGGVGTVGSDKSQDLDLALGQIGKPAASRRGQRLPGLLACEPGARQRSTVAGARCAGRDRGRRSRDAPVHGHAGNLLLGAGQADGYLVFEPVWRERTLHTGRGGGIAAG
jgi:hypothetical protein